MTMNDEVRAMNDERRRRRRYLTILLCSSFIIHRSSFCLATLRQDEVLKSINQNVGQDVDPTKLLAVVLSIVGLIVVIALINYRRKRVVIPKVLNHPGKLVKEVTRAVNLKPGEVKRLKVLAEQKELDSPLLLLLCPSLLQKKREDVKPET
jgi:hypothetical protein